MDEKKYNLSGPSGIAYAIVESTWTSYVTMTNTECDSSQYSFQVLLHEAVIKAHACAL